MQTFCFPGLGIPSHPRARRPRSRRTPDLRLSEQPPGPKPDGQRDVEFPAHPGLRQERQRRQGSQDPNPDGAEKHRETGRRRRKQTGTENVQQGDQGHVLEEINKLSQTAHRLDFLQVIVHWHELQVCRSNPYFNIIPNILPELQSAKNE